MSFLPIVVRELSLACRRRGTYRVRTGTALVTMAIFLAMVVSNRRSTAELGRQVFAVLSTWAFAYALLSGVRCTADSLSSERREGTLGLLFLTPLRGYDVVLGKLVVTSLDAAYGLLAMLPMLAVPVLLGAVTGVEFWRMNLCLLNTLLFSLVVGLVISTFGREERGVMLATLVVLLAVTLGLPLLWRAVTRVVDHRVFDLLLFPSPVYGFKMAFASSLRLAGREYWLSMLVVAALSLAGLGLSSALLVRVFQEKERPGLTAKWQAWLERWRFGHLAGRSAEEGSAIGPQPFFWLLTRDRLPRFWMGLFALVTLLFAMWVPTAFVRPSTPATPIAMFGAFGLHLLFKLLVTAEASRRLNLDKKSGALELLLATPLSIPSIVAGQMLALQKRFLLPFLSLALLNCLMVAAVQRHDDMPGGFGGLAVGVFDSYALSWVGMLTGLREPRYVRAVFRGLGAVMVWPWAAMLLFVLYANAMNVSSSTAKGFFFYWYLGSAVYDLAIAKWAREQLLSRFRLLGAGDLRSPRLLPYGLTPRRIWAVPPGAG